MEKKFRCSSEILELKPLYEQAAINLAQQLIDSRKSPAIVAIDCVPNGKLNVFHYQDGLKTAAAIITLGQSFLGDYQKLINDLIVEASQNKPLATDFKLGERLGLWQRIRANDYKSINWQQPFVVKSADNKAKIWHPDWRAYRQRFRDNSFATENAIARFIYENTAYIQDWQNPLTGMVKDPSWRVIFRLVFGKKTDQELIPLGGVWIGRRAYKIYPGPDSLVGLIAAQKPLV